MRADARRNLELLRIAAQECFREQGLGVSVKEISRRAGVSPGTLYNLYGDREGLIDAVVADLAGSLLDDVIARADTHHDPWDAFTAFVEGVCELQASNPALGDVLARRCPGAVRVAAVFDRALQAGARYIESAQAAQQLRADFHPEDLLYIFGGNAELSRATEPVAPGNWRRGVAFYLAGLRAPAWRQLTIEPLTRGQLHKALDLLARG
ncbi:TetR/AcrR family transcriptional regulator [Actinoplanes sp. CA-131856]